MRLLRLWLYVVAASLLWAACASTEETTRTEGEARTPPETTTEAEPPPPEAEPEEEPEPEAEPEERAPVTRTVQGFRIQVHTSANQAEAEAELAAAMQWWEGLPRARRPLGLDVDSFDVYWQQPYYRVRIGAFANRAEAEEALALVKPQFREAFIVPDRVTVTR